ncbi:MAG TPA: OmpW family outer membrane protein [Steroidobacteraceae bacterium]|nr:OmpW family outer membrane protein [Steroidobacteraceae bacterium]
MKNTKILAGVGLLLVCGAGSAMAADAIHGNEIRLGLYIVQYDAHADDITGPFVPKGLNVNVKNVNTAYVAYVRRLSPNFVLELAAGVPPKTETTGKGPAMLGSVPFDGQVISTAKWFAPTLLLNYVFLDESSAWRPYFGVGANYTKFYDRQSTAAGNAANGGPTSISLTSSLGPAATLGVRWHLQDRWSLYASYSYSVVRSNLVANTAGVLRRTHIDFNPTTLVLSVGFAF